MPPDPSPLEQALDRAWLASSDARGHARPPDLAEHLARELRLVPAPAAVLDPGLRAAATAWKQAYDGYHRLPFDRAFIAQYNRAIDALRAALLAEDSDAT